MVICYISSKKLIHVLDPELHTENTCCFETQKKLFNTSKFPYILCFSLLIYKKEMLKVFFHGVVVINDVIYVKTEIHKDLLIIRGT